MLTNITQVIAIFIFLFFLVESKAQPISIDYGLAQTFNKVGLAYPTKDKYVKKNPFLGTCIRACTEKKILFEDWIHGI